MENLKSHMGLAFTTGSKLTGKELNSMVEGIDTLVDLENLRLKTEANINLETGDFLTTYTLQEAIEQVPEERRTSGIVVKFINEDQEWKEFVWNGFDPETQWSDTNFWKLTLDEDIIDGGEW